MAFVFLVLILAFPLTGFAQTTELESSEDAAKQRSTFDAALAEELGADEYGMHRYVMAFLKAGPNRDQDAEASASLQRAHLQNIRRLKLEGKLVLAGPFLDDGEIRGIYIFAVETVEEARKLTESDPAIQAGRLAMELHPWYGSAALKQVGAIHEQLRKKSF